MAGLAVQDDMFSPASGQCIYKASLPVLLRSIIFSIHSQNAHQGTHSLKSHPISVTINTFQVAVTSLLLSTACAIPYPPSVAVSSPLTDIPGSVFAVKKPNGGNFMPGDHPKATRTTSADSATVGELNRRQKGERVQNGNLANYNVDYIHDGNGNGVDSYTMYWGSGSISDGWPDKSRWVSFENMFNNYKNQMFQSCGWQNPSQPNNSGPEVGAIWDGIQKAAAASGVDHRLILAVMMQESHGCVRAPTTNYGVRNPGLMQDHNGHGTCNDNGWVQTPCPSSTIYEMISEGTAGTDSGDGLANCINQADRGDVSAFYRAARIYNSGSISDTGALQNGIATHCYASDIAK
ncbi:hypothetical protein QQS21_007819 [Conoideocrella luteorostrata]|uniref:Uncharacterized protein n=1 Tax=Conoideocrella luteorostrata TaxID=1105319 RepID=A0AAJ0CMT9_9HYPO|nr:hypothetical protein QQS21_007819 [Conoideocrella luteorostrata]